MHDVWKSKNASLFQLASSGYLCLEIRCVRKAGLHSADNLITDHY